MFKHNPDNKPSQDAIDATRVLGSTLVIASSLRHVHALQALMGDRIATGPVLNYNDLKPGRTPAPDLVWLKTDSPNAWLNQLDPKDSFLADQVFIVTPTWHLHALRDQTGYRYGSYEDGVGSGVLLDRFAAVCLETPDPDLETVHCELDDSLNHEDRLGLVGKLIHQPSNDSYWRLEHCGRQSLTAYECDKLGNRLVGNVAQLEPPVTEPQSERQQQQIVVEIKGDIHSGRTIVAALLEKALVEAGFTQVEITNKDGDIVNSRQHILNGLKGHVLSNNVHIVDNNEPELSEHRKLPPRLLKFGRP